MKINNNWFQSNFLNKSAERFEVKIVPYPFIPLPFMKAAEHTAKLIQIRYNDRQLYLGLSGGADSEFIARLFTRLGIPFAPIIIKSGVNNEDVMNAIDLCAELELTPFVVRRTQDDVVRYYLDKIYPHHNDGLIHVHQMLVVEKAAELGGVAILGETHIYDPDPTRSVVKAFKFLPDLLYTDVIPFYYYTLELTYAEMKEVREGEAAQQFKARVRGTTPRYVKTLPIFVADDLYYQQRRLEQTLRPEWLYHDMGTPKGFLERVEEYTI